MLQRLLSAHDAVSSTAEPWFLLPPLWSLRPDGAYSTYSHREVHRAVGDMLPQLRYGRRSYLDGVAAFAAEVYAAASDPGARYFLDKTPRYALIARELLETFPDARFIFLWRNPLAVVASVIETWMGGRFQPHHHMIDFFDGLDGLLEARATDHLHVATVRYEDLVTDTEDQVQRLLQFLGLPRQDGLVGEQANVELPGRLGDPLRHTHRPVVASSVARWPRVFAAPVRRRWAHRYLDWLGPGRATAMGYDLDAIRRDLDAPAVRRDTIARDLYDMGKSALWGLVEPQISRSKVSDLRRRQRLYSHT